MNTFSYVIDNKIYVNLTNRCSNACEFCVRNTDAYGDYSLWLDKEPTAQEVIDSLKDKDLASRDEVVFCGYGEPTYRMDVMIEVADYVHAHGKKTRINTNGQGSLINNCDVPAMFEGHIDIVNVSLNETDATAYQNLCHSEFGEGAFDALIDFARECKKYVERVIFSVVDVIGADKIEKARLIAEEAGVELRVREYIP